MSTVPGLGLVLAILGTALGNGRKAKFTTAGLKQTKDNLTYLAGLAESGQLRPTIDRQFPLEAMPEAHRYVDTGRKTGTVIIQVAG
jgi:NADPH:quinone reductase-like Zn-dependent oxidoreductase